MNHFCNECGQDFNPLRAALGYKLCLDCGETVARERKHCIVPLPKSNYVVVTDLDLLKCLVQKPR